MTAAVLAAALVLSVPYLPQTDALCGGAAAAMVFRFWGDAHAGVQQFAPLVDRRAGGIASDALVRAIVARGWTADRVDGSLASIDGQLAHGEPVIVLLAERRSRYHYVVVIGHANGAIVVHDPAWGPNREIPETEFMTRWGGSGRWALSVTPKVPLKPDTTSDRAATYVVSGFSRTDGGGFSWTGDASLGRTDAAQHDDCDAALDRAINEVRAHGVDSADRILGAVRARCPRSAGPLRELAGVRFAQQRWHDAASLARQALAIDPHDAYASDVLGSSLFMLDDPVAALRAWNRIGKPILDRVRISGLRHARYEAIDEAIGLTSGVLLTADDFEQARRRLDELPDRATARLDVRPDADGFAAVDIVIVERAAVPKSAGAWAVIGVGALVDRQVTATLPGFSREGETWKASYRWWEHRPRAEVEFAAPRFAGLPGIWRVNASWESQAYEFGSGAPQVTEERAHADVSVSDWFTPRWRYTARTGVDGWTGDHRAMFVGGSIERRLAHDRISLRGDADTWFAAASTPAFSSTDARASWISAPVVREGWTTLAIGGVQHVSDGAPFALWPGAGDGHERDALLRAHPMLDEGVLSVTTDSAFGRTLTFGTIEAQRWVATRWPVDVGVAGFIDAAHAADRNVGGPTTQVDIGAGLRLRLPGMSHVLRIDAAHGLRDGANAVTIGWTY